MLELRLAEGLPLDAARRRRPRRRRAAPPPTACRPGRLAAGRVRLTLRGRLLADAVVRRGAAELGLTRSPRGYARRPPPHLVRARVRAREDVRDAGDVGVGQDLAQERDLGAAGVAVALGDGEDRAVVLEDPPAAGAVVAAAARPRRGSRPRRARARPRRRARRSPSPSSRSRVRSTRARRRRSNARATRSGSSSPM